MKVITLCLLFLAACGSEEPNPEPTPTPFPAWYLPKGCIIECQSDCYYKCDLSFIETMCTEEK
jgi:hypothetical protein